MLVDEKVINKFRILCHDTHDVLDCETVVCALNVLVSFGLNSERFILTSVLVHC